MIIRQLLMAAVRRLSSLVIALVPAYLWALVFVRNPVSAAVLAVIGLAGVQLTIRVCLAAVAVLDYW